VCRWWWPRVPPGCVARGYLLSRPKVKAVIPDTSSTAATTELPPPDMKRLLLLNETITEPGASFFLAMHGACLGIPS